MNNGNQPPYNPNNYPLQTYGHVQPGRSTRHNQEGYQPSQQPIYYAIDPSQSNYVYPMAPGGNENYTMAPAFPVQAEHHGYAIPGGDLGQHPSTHSALAWSGSPSSPGFNGGYPMEYLPVDHGRPYTPSQAAASSWQYPTVRSSTPQPQTLRQDQRSQHNQSISLVEATGMPYGEAILDPSGKHKCPLCPSLHARKNDVQRHIRSVHTNELRYTCSACGEGFPRSDARGLHWKNYPRCKELHLQRGGV